MPAMTSSPPQHVRDDSGSVDGEMPLASDESGGVSVCTVKKLRGTSMYDLNMTTLSANDENLANADELLPPVDFSKRARWSQWVKPIDQEDIGKILRDLDAVGLSRDNLRVPKELLKFGRWGRPKMRSFKLTGSGDTLALEWEGSTRKTPEQTRVMLNSVQVFVIGQGTNPFKRFANSKALTHYHDKSFSLIFRTEEDELKSLDVACNTREEWYHYVAGLFDIFDREIFGAPPEIEAYEINPPTSAGLRSNSGSSSLSKSSNAKGKGKKTSKIAALFEKKEAEAKAPKVHKPNEALAKDLEVLAKNARVRQVQQKAEEFQEESRLEFERFCRLSKQDQAVKRVEKLDKITEEIIQSERLYYNFLDTIVKHIVGPARALVAKKKGFEHKHFQGLFLNIESILPVHKLLHDALETFEKNLKSEGRQGSGAKCRSSMPARAATMTGLDSPSANARTAFRKSPRIAALQNGFVKKKSSKRLSMSSAITAPPVPSSPRSAPKKPPSKPPLPSVESLSPRSSVSVPSPDSPLSLASSDATPPPVPSRPRKGSTFHLVKGITLTRVETSPPSSPTLGSRTKSAPPSPHQTVLSGGSPRSIGSSTDTMPQMSSRSQSVGQEPEPTEFTSIAEIFLKFCAYFRIYAPYVGEYESVSETFKSLQTNDTFQGFLTELEANPAVNQPLLSYLIMPVQRLPRYRMLLAVNQPLLSYLIMPVQRLPRYRMLLAELLKYSDKSSKETKQLERALEKVAKVADEINERKRASENQARIIEVQNLVKRPLVTPSRYIVHEGMLHRTNKQKPVHLYLFNDLFLYTNDRGKFLGSHDWGDVTVLKRHAGTHTTITLTSPYPDENGRQLHLTVVFPTPADLERWLKHLTELTEKYKQIKREETKRFLNMRQEKKASQHRRSRSQSFNPEDSSPGGLQIDTQMMSLPTRSNNPRSLSLPGTPRAQKLSPINRTRTLTPGAKSPDPSLLPTPPRTPVTLPRVGVNGGGASPSSPLSASTLARRMRSLMSSR